MSKKPRKVVKPKVESKKKPEETIVVLEDTYSGTKKEDSGVILKASEPTEAPIPTSGILVPKSSKREQIDKHLSTISTILYPAPTSLQWGIEIYPWLKQLAELLA